MPEGPEVRCMRDCLSQRIKNKILESITLHQGPYVGSSSPKYSEFRERVKEFTPSSVKKVRVKGKYMWFEFEDGDFVALGIHHGMEGSWCEGEDVNFRHIILTLNFEDGYRLRFQDSRRFGTFRLYSDEG